jgi:hypothetical protein
VPPHVSEESFKLKRLLLFASLAAVAAALMPLAAAGQVSNDEDRAPVQHNGSTFKYEAYLGFAYTSLNQLNLSRYGLEGVQLSVTRDYGNYFGIRGSGDYYKHPVSSGNPGDPSVYSVLGGPEFHAKVYGAVSGLAFAELGVEHTSGENMNPDTSFAGGFGGGATYDFTPRLAAQVTGDRVAGSFSFANNTPQLAYSGHRTWNARATIGVVYRFGINK